MKKILLLILMTGITVFSQNKMTPELLFKVGRVSAMGISKDGKDIIYKVATPSVEENKSNTVLYSIPVVGGKAAEISEARKKELLIDKNISPDGKLILYSEAVKLDKVLGTDYYPEMKLSDVKIYNALDYRHWDTWNVGEYNHLFYKNAADEKAVGIDIMKGEKYNSPQKHFGGDEDYVWSPDAKSILYVSKKKSGNEYALSTNTDIYEYVLATGETKNKTADNLGYDTSPQFSTVGSLAWLSMKRDGYEADKNDIIVENKGVKTNLTEKWDNSVADFKWSADGKRIYFIAAVDGTKQLFEISNLETKKITQLTDGIFDVNDIVGFAGKEIIVTRTDMNHATEIFSYNQTQWRQITNVNTELYNSISLSKTEKRYVATTDGKKMLVWVVYPPDFNPAKKYPTLLYCQGGPQSPLTQFYSFRWNFQLMAAKGYIVVAPNRRGMHGFGVKWNEEISGDWGGQVMRDYLSAIDDVSKEKYVDKTKLGCVGASFGGYSVFYLAGIHENRFKTFISHDGVFNFQSMYGTTEELFFNNWEQGGAYWEKDKETVRKSYSDFNPINYIDKWNTPILIVQGGNDFRVPIGQGQEAFQAAQLKGIKSRFLYFPEENHWVLKPQNAIVWQKEFFKWLEETL